MKLEMDIMYQLKRNGLEPRYAKDSELRWWRVDWVRRLGAQMTAGLGASAWLGVGRGVWLGVGRWLKLGCAGVGGSGWSGVGRSTTVARASTIWTNRLGPLESGVGWRWAVRASAEAAWSVVGGSTTNWKGRRRGRFPLEGEGEIERKKN